MNLREMFSRITNIAKVPGSIFKKPPVERWRGFYKVAKSHIADGRGRSVRIHDWHDMGVLTYKNEQIGKTLHLRYEWITLIGREVPAIIVWIRNSGEYYWGEKTKLSPDELGKALVDIAQLQLLGFPVIYEKTDIESWYGLMGEPPFPGEEASKKELSNE